MITAPIFAKPITHYLPIAALHHFLRHKSRFGFAISLR